MANVSLARESRLSDRPSLSPADSIALQAFARSLLETPLAEVDVVLPALQSPAPEISPIRRVLLQTRPSMETLRFEFEVRS